VPPRGSPVHALAGDDTLAGSHSADVFDGGPGIDHSLQMLDGVDTCVSVGGTRRSPLRIRRPL